MCYNIIVRRKGKEIPDPNDENIVQPRTNILDREIARREAES